MLKRSLGGPIGWIWLAASAVCYGSVLISPGIFWPAQFIGFAIPWVILANCLIAIFLILSRRFRLAAIPIVCLVPAIWFVPATFQLGPGRDAPQNKPVLRVLSFNMASLAGKRWRPQMRRLNAREMMQWILKRDDDLLILQEFYENPAVEEFTPIRKLKRAGFKHLFFSNHKSANAKKGYGLAIASKNPIRNLKVFERRIETNNQIMTCEMTWSGKTYQVINVHLQSNKLTWDEIGIKRTPEELRKNFFSVFRKMRLASKLRAQQVATLCHLIEESPYPVILAGDFNDTPYSYTYWQIRRRLTNSFEKAGSGFGFTYNGKLPGLRIDHQFVSDGLTCTTFRTHKEVDLSDHLPISGVYTISDHR